MKDAKGHGSNPRGSHSAGVDKVGQPFWGVNKAQNIERAQQFLKDSGVNSEVYNSPRAYAIAHATSDDNTVHLNAGNNFWRDPQKVMSEHSEVRNRPGSLANRQNIFDVYKGRYYSSDVPEHLLNHEMGHLLYEDVPKAQNKFTPDQVRSVRERVSGYAAHNPTEFIAEVHAGMRAGVKYPDSVMGLFNQYARKRK